MFRPRVVAGKQDMGQKVGGYVKAFAGAIADVTLSGGAQGVFQRMRRFTLIQADLCAALHVSIQ